MTRPVVIGVTGQIACGKSTVLSELELLGAESIDADRVYHELIQPDRDLWRALVERFGPSIIGPNRQIDRRALGAIVFSDAQALADLDRLTHPAVIDEVMARIEHSTAGVVAVDAVKLVESGLADHCDHVWIVTCTPDQQRQRLQQRNNLSALEAERRIAAQSPLAPLLARADLVIDNSGSLAATRRQVQQAWSGIIGSGP